LVIVFIIDWMSSSKQVQLVMASDAWQRKVVVVVVDDVDVCIGTTIPQHLLPESAQPKESHLTPPRCVGPPDKTRTNTMALAQRQYEKKRINHLVGHHHHHQHHHNRIHVFGTWYVFLFIHNSSPFFCGALLPA